MFILAVAVFVFWGQDWLLACGSLLTDLSKWAVKIFEVAGHS
jgi:hypothetical protein